MRLVWGLVLLALLAGSAGPLASYAYAAVDSAEGDACPMGLHPTPQGPCIGAPCPCTHRQDVPQLTASVPFTLPEGRAVPAGPLRRIALATAPWRPLAAGFPYPIDHPPDPAA
jgi:hypothetical protein